MEERTLIQLEQLIEKKLQILRRYGELTDSLQTADIDHAGDILEERQEVIRETDAVTGEINGVAAALSPAEREELSKLLRFEKEEAEGDLAPVAEKLRELKRLFIALAEKEKSASGRLNHLREKLLKKLERSNRDKKVMDFVSSTSGAEFFRGRELDEKS